MRGRHQEPGVNLDETQHRLVRHWSAALTAPLCLVRMARSQVGLAASEEISMCAVPWLLGGNTSEYGKLCQAGAPPDKATVAGAASDTRSTRRRRCCSRSSRPPWRLAP